MDTDEIIIWVALGVAILLALLFFFFAITTGGIKAFAIYILFPLFIISFLVGMTMLVNLIIKLNDKIENNALGLNKKIDTNNFLIKETIDNVDNYLQNVDYTVIVEDRNVPITVDEVDQLGAPFRYKPIIYEPSLEIPGIISKESDSLNENNIKRVDIITNEEENLKSIQIENKEDIKSINETLIEDSDSIIETLSINETLIEDSDFYNFYETEDIILPNNIIETEFETTVLHSEFVDNYNIF